MSDAIRIKMTVETSFSRSVYEDFQEVDRAEWEALSQSEQDELLDELALEFLHENTSCSAVVVDENAGA